jgi:hypothetical protein
MGARRLQFVIYVPKGVRVSDINTIEDHIQIDVLEDHDRIDRLPFKSAKKKYG